MNLTEKQTQIANRARLDTAGDSVNVNANHKERESIQVQININPHKRDTENTNESPSIFTLDTVPHELLLATIHPHHEFLVCVGVMELDPIQRREWRRKEEKISATS